ncbi:hypothetical protein HF998_17110, partial [Cellulomonas hominis]|nr:hypothetical protein [Cellulomonas hominis]
MRSSEDDGTTGGHDPSGAAGDDDGDATGARSADAAVPDALDEDAAPGDPAGPTLTVAAVAGRLGVAPATLRT